MTHPPKPAVKDGPAGAIVHWAARYDLLVAFLTLGRERHFREQLLAPARLQPGESVLDIGCGTGTLAIAARRQVGSSGKVAGVDASPEMIERARHKAAKAGVDVTFETALAQALPFPDARFDVVLSTVMLHHLPRAMREVAVREARRVLMPGGRLLVVDFVKTAHKGLMGRIHPHGRVDARDLIALVTGAGLAVSDSGPMKRWGLQFVVARSISI